MPETAIHIDADTGEVSGSGCARCHALEVQLGGAQRDIETWRLRHDNLKRKVNTGIKEHPRYEEVKELFIYWKKKCGHPNSPFTKARFEIALPFLEDYGADMCRRAIDGLAYDPYKRQRRNGSWIVYNDWEKHLFPKSGTFEERCNCAPLEAT